MSIKTLNPHTENMIEEIKGVIDTYKHVCNLPKYRGKVKREHELLDKICDMHATLVRMHGGEKRVKDYFAKELECYGHVRNVDLQRLAKM